MSPPAIDERALAKALTRCRELPNRERHAVWNEVWSVGNQASSPRQRNLDEASHLIALLAPDIRPMS